MDTLERTSDPFPIGHNSGAAPLAELLVEETAPLRVRADALIASAGKAHVEDDDTAGRATTLAKMIGDHVKAIEVARVERKQPFLDAGRTVDNHFGALAQPLGAARKGVVDKIDAYRRRKEAEAAAERRRIEEEAALARADAERAAAALQESGGTDLEAEIAANDAAARAETLTRKAATVAPATIDTGYGVKAVGRKVYRVAITDLTAAIRHARKVDEATLRAAVQQIYDRQVRAGVRELPGATVTEDTATTIR